MNTHDLIRLAREYAAMANEPEATTFYSYCKPKLEGSAEHMAYLLGQLADKYVELAKAARQVTSHMDNAAFDKAAECIEGLADDMRALRDLLGKYDGY